MQYPEYSYLRKPFSPPRTLRMLDKIFIAWAISLILAFVLGIFVGAKIMKSTDSMERRIAETAIVGRPSTGD